MRIEAYYPDLDTSEQLNRRFPLNYSGQDWATVNADHKILGD